MIDSYFTLNTTCIAMNALIDLDEHRINKLSLDKLDKYFCYVANEYERLNNTRVIVKFGKGELNALIYECGNYIEIENIGNCKYIKLKDNVDIFEIKDKFRYTLSYNMLKTLKDINILEVIK